MTIKIEIPSDPRLFEAAKAFFEALCPGTEAAGLRAREADDVKRAYLGPEPVGESEDDVSTSTGSYQKRAWPEDRNERCLQHADYGLNDMGIGEDETEAERRERLGEDETDAEKGMTLDTAPAEGHDADIPWDARIHSSSKKKVKKTGHWVRRKYLTQETLEKVELELVAAGKGEPKTEVAAVGSPWHQLCVRVSERLKEGKIESAALKRTAETLGLPDFAGLNSRPDLYEAFEKALEGGQE